MENGCWQKKISPRPKNADARRKMTVSWVLLWITAVGIEDFKFKNRGVFETIAECHVAATQIFWEDMPINEEAVCIRVETLGVYWE